MKILDQMEKWIRPFATPNVTVGIIGLQVVAYLLAIAKPEFVQSLLLDRNLVLQGEVWRLITFVIVPPGGILLFALFYWFIFYMTGSALENTWGTARYNLYLLIAYLAIVTVGMVVPGAQLGLDSAVGTSGILYSSVFLAFAYEFPDFEFLIMFVLPIKVRWLAIIQWLLYGFAFLNFLSIGQLGASLMIVAAVVNFLLFYGPTLWRRAKGQQRKMAQRAEQVRLAGKPRHTCSICGITNLDDRKAEFRYCSQCDGDRCYCLEHLGSHTHVTSQTQADEQPSAKRSRQQTDA